MIRGKRTYSQVMAVFLLTLMLVLSASYAHAQDCGSPTTNGLVGYWALDETGGTTAADSSGNGFNGTYQEVSGGDFTLGVDAPVGTGVDFSDASNFEVVHNVTIGNLNQYTIAAWVQYNQGAATSPTLFNKSSEYSLYGVDTYMEFWSRRWGSLAGRWRVNTSEFPTDGRWFHLAITYDVGSTANDPVIYINGESVDITEFWAPSGSLLVSSSNLTFGNTTGLASNSQWEGSIDDVRLYNNVLSEEKIADLYKYGRGEEGAMIFNQNQSALEYCNGTDWVMAGTGSYNPNAITINRATETDQVTGSHGISADSKTVTGSFWFRTDGSDFYVTTGSGGEGMNINMDASGDFKVEGRTAAGTEILDIRATGTGVANQWQHVLFSFDLSDPAKRHIYIDDVSGLDTINTYTDDFIDFTVNGDDLRLPANASSSIEQVADFWLDSDTYIDLSKEDNRRKFISASGMPMYLGADGSIPTGAAPDIFLSGDTENWHINKGTGGGFTENGEITYSSSRPGDEATLGGTGYFVEGPLTNGDMGGISGAAATCLSSLQSSDWLGKSTAEANGQLTQGNVRPWLCTLTECQNLRSEDIYTYASISNTTRGGGTMTASVEGYTEDDGLAYENNAAFGNDNGFRRFWTGRGIENQTPYSSTCTDWTSNSSGINSTNTPSDVSYYPEKLGTTIDNCNTSQRLICIVDPPDCGEAGVMRYNGNYNVMEYCNGVEWVAMGPVGGTPPTDGLVAHWAFDETSGTTPADSSGNGNDGTVDSGTPIWEPALIDNGVSNAEFGRTNPTGLSTTEVTASAWVKITTNFDFNDIINFNWSSGTGGYAMYSTASGAIEFGVMDGGSQRMARVFNAVEVGKWMHWVGVYDGTDIKLYIDGTLVDTTSGYPGITLQTSGDFWFADANGYTILDDVRVYDRALTDQEIMQLYHYGTSQGLGDVDNGCGVMGGYAVTEGQMIYNADFNVMQYCNGEEWIGIGQ